MGNKLKALRFMAKVMMTRANMDRWERERDHRLLADPVLSPESDEWLASAQRQTLALAEIR